MAKSNEKWKDQYLRILTSGILEPDDYRAAAELISDGYATGLPKCSKGKDSYGAVNELNQFAVTTKGRLFADELASQTRAARFRGLMVKGAIAIISAAFGIGITWVQKSMLGC